MLKVCFQITTTQTKLDQQHSLQDGVANARVPDGSTERYKPVLATRPLQAEQGLLNPCAATLNQNNQHDDKKQSGDDPDNRGLVHVDSLPS